MSSVVRRALFTKNFVILVFFTEMRNKNVCDVPLFLNLSLVQKVDGIHLIFPSHALNLC